jgi:hypothetical protein
MKHWLLPRNGAVTTRQSFYYKTMLLLKDDTATTRRCCYYKTVLLLQDGAATTRPLLLQDSAATKLCWYKKLPSGTICLLYVKTNFNVF